jgi:hypothetical protein
MAIRTQTGDGVLGDDVRHVIGSIGTFRTEPLRGPVERAEKRARRDGRIGRGERAPLDAVRDERAYTALVPIALGHDDRAQAAGQGIDLEMRGGAFDLVEQAEHMGARELPQPILERPASAARVGERAEQLVGRAVLAEEEQLVFAAEVVIQIARRQVRRGGDVAHTGGGEAAIAEDAGRGGENPDAPRVGAL